MHKYNYHTAADDDDTHLGRDLFLDILTIIAVCWIAFRGCCKSCCRPQPTGEVEEVVLASAVAPASSTAAPDIPLTTLNYPNTVEIPIGGHYSELWEEWNGIPSPEHDPSVQLSPVDSGQEPPPSYEEAVNGYWTRLSSTINA